ncbi:hypothetical protein HB364_17680 [Pseudoflavitalea sp. X16]|uniref:hypothetical protein n=1 Tax=Paraflavitalea devenefica TaxID=2716334 RepID=UPI001422BFCB|nr:hypothetical protein [Paraflavitalea devenefica]NII26925.1 hypothetical protein [Paraflavitalea devenefica]
MKTSYIVARGIPGNGTNIVNIQLLSMLKKRKFDPRIPPCPDPDKYTLVRGKHHYYWRRNRGTIKPAVLNEVMSRSAAITSKTNRAAKHMMSLLAVFTQQMSLGMSTTEVGGAFKRAYLQDGRMDFRFMHEIKFQEEHPIHKLFKGAVYPKIERGSIQLQIGVGGPNVKAPSRYAAGYRFTAILLYGDPSKDRGIRIETGESETYSFKEKNHVDCKLSLVLPAKNRPWTVLLHIGCKMTDSLPAGPRYHAMWVVKAG